MSLKLLHLFIFQRVISVTMGFKIIKTLTLSKSLSAGFIYGWRCQGLLNQSAWLCPTKSKANEKNSQRIQQQNLPLSQSP